MGLIGFVTRMVCTWDRSRANVCIRIFTQAEFSNKSDKTGGGTRRRKRKSSWLPFLVKTIFMTKQQQNETRIPNRRLVLICGGFLRFDWIQL